MVDVTFKVTVELWLPDETTLTTWDVMVDAGATVTPDGVDEVDDELDEADALSEPDADADTEPDADPDNDADALVEALEEA